MKAAPIATLLVVEDDAKLRSVLERTLTFEGYTVTSRADGVDDLGALTAGTYDAVSTCEYSTRKQIQLDDLQWCCALAREEACPNGCMPL